MKSRDEGGSVRDESMITQVETVLFPASPMSPSALIFHPSSLLFILAFRSAWRYLVTP
jgi:hypothetical protein